MAGVIRFSQKPPFNGKLPSGGRIAPVSITPVLREIISPSLSVGPAAWYDFSDVGSQTREPGFGTTGIADKSGNDRDLSLWLGGPLGLYPPFRDYWQGINGWHTGHISQGAYLRSTTPGLTIAEFYTIVQYFQGVNAFLNAGLLNPFSSTEPSWFTGGNMVTGLASNTGSVYLNGDNNTNRVSNLFDEIRKPCLVRWVANGSPITTNERFVLGQDRTFQNTSFVGLVGEVIIFSSYLQEADRSTIENYLLDKWVFSKPF
jgi:hypothetical protein